MEKVRFCVLLFEKMPENVKSKCKKIEKNFVFVVIKGKEVRQRANLPFALPLFLRVCVTKRQEGYSCLVFYSLRFSYAIFAISRANLSLLVSKSKISLG